MKNPSTPRIRFDHDRREGFVRGREVYFPPKEYALLEALIKSNKAMTREELLKEIWGIDAPQDSRTVDQHAARARARLKQDRDLIATVAGYGYRFDGAKLPA